MPAGSFVNSAIVSNQETNKFKRYFSNIFLRTRKSMRLLKTNVPVTQLIHVKVLNVLQYLCTFWFCITATGYGVMHYHIFQGNDLIFNVGCRFTGPTLLRHNFGADTGGCTVFFETKEASKLAYYYNMNGMSLLYLQQQICVPRRGLSKWLWWVNTPNSYFGTTEIKQNKFIAFSDTLSYLCCIWRKRQIMTLSVNRLSVFYWLFCFCLET